MSDIVNMTEAMKNDGFVGDWYSIINMGKAYRVQQREGAYRVFDMYNSPAYGDNVDNLIEEVKEFRNEEAN